MSCHGCDYMDDEQYLPCRTHGCLNDAIRDSYYCADHVLLCRQADFEQAELDRQSQQAMLGDHVGPIERERRNMSLDDYWRAAVLRRAINLNRATLREVIRDGL